MRCSHIQIVPSLTDAQFLCNSEREAKTKSFEREKKEMAQLGMMTARPVAVQKGTFCPLGSSSAQ